MGIKRQARKASGDDFCPWGSTLLSILFSDSPEVEWLKYRIRIPRFDAAYLDTGGAKRKIQSFYIGWARQAESTSQKSRIAWHTLTGRIVADEFRVGR